jgi:hypothetical protein
MDTQNNRELAEVLGNLALEMQSLHDTGAVLRTIVAASIHVVVVAARLACCRQYWGPRLTTCPTFHTRRHDGDSRGLLR